jgi:hypothetical protein
VQPYSLGLPGVGREGEGEQVVHRRRCHT